MEPAMGAEGGNRGPGSRNRLLLAGGSVVVVLAVVATLLVVKLTQSPAHSTPSAAASSASTHSAGTHNAGTHGAVAPSDGAASAAARAAAARAAAVRAAAARAAAQVQQQVISVPAATFDTIGAGTATGLNTVSGQPPLAIGGKPELLFIGGEFCPYCAAERWALAAAVSRFGTLSGLSLISSSPTDVDANTPTVSFAKATYTSNYLTFVPVEWFGETTNASGTGYVIVQQPTAQQQAILDKYDSNEAIPFADIGNRYILPQVQYDPAALAGLSWAQVAAAMHDPSSGVAKDIDGAANILTAAICALTNGQPGSVCQSSGVKAAAHSI